MTVFVRAGGDPQALAGPARDAVRAVDATLPIVGLQTLDDHVSLALGRPRFLLTVMTGFGGAVLLLAVLGVYGLLSYAVAQRRFEFAVRQALGAAPGALIRLVLQEGLTLTIVGLAAGLVIAALAARGVRSLLFGVAALDPPTFLYVAATVFFMSASASLVPALRAVRVEAAFALKES